MPVRVLIGRDFSPAVGVANEDGALAPEGKSIVILTLTLSAVEGEESPYFVQRTTHCIIWNDALFHAAQRIQFARHQFVQQRRVVSRVQSSASLGGGTHKEIRLPFQCCGFVLADVADSITAN